jgi:hypothetical protein
MSARADHLMRRLIGVHPPTLPIETNMRLQSCVNTSELAQREIPVDALW